jgi:subtilisin family serine protease
MKEQPMSDCYYDDEILDVPWNSEAWDCAVQDRPDIGMFGRVLYTPSRLVVDTAAVAASKETRRVLERIGARESSCAEVKMARRLGLTIFTAPDNELIDAVRRIRSCVPGAASLQHVWLPGGNRIHGDDLPEPADDPQNIPGDGEAGAGLTIFVLDTGIAPSVPFEIDPADIGPDDLEQTDEDGNDVRDYAAGHGTHVAGLIARTAPRARIVPRRLLTSPVGMADEFACAQAISQAAADGANLISCSWGGTSLDDAPPLATARAIEQLPPGTVVVAAAGNSFSEQLTWPAACNGVIAVGSVGQDTAGNWARTNFSNYGPWVDCCAPGVAVASTFIAWSEDDGAPPEFTGFATWSGTSMSTPQVTAAIAALATRDAISPSEAAYRLVFDPARRKIGPVGTLVVPTELP